MASSDHHPLTAAFFFEGSLHLHAKLFIFRFNQ